MRATILGLAVFLALVLVGAIALSATLEGCSVIVNQIVCDQGTSIRVFPA